MPLSKNGRPMRLRLRQGAFFIAWPLLLLLAVFSFPSRQPTGPTIVRENPTSYTSTSSLRRGQLEGAGGDQGDANGLFSGWVSTESSPPPLAPQKTERVKSKVRIAVSSSGSGLINKFYYRFENVRLKKRKLTVYYDDKVESPPTEEYWVDIISTNGTLPKPPTMLVIKGDVHDTNWYYIPVVYEPASKKQPRCTSWIDNPTYLLQARYSYNIWHTWNEGLMGVFQTFRELGHLPLASVASDGTLSEITDGMGEGCPYEWSDDLQKVVQPTDCSPREGLLKSEKCDPSVDAWCHEGSVISTRRYDNGPVILPYTASSLVNIWAHLYHAITENVLDWSVADGACFKEFIVGKTSTLNFYQSIADAEIDEENKIWPRINALDARVEAMAVFKAFVTSSQRDYVKQQIDAGEPAWNGYSDPAMERLRRGIGPEDLKEDVLQGLVPTSVPGMLRHELSELRKLWRQKAKATAVLVKEYLATYGGADGVRKGPPANDAEALAVAEQFDDYESRAARAQERILAGTAGESDGVRRHMGTGTLTSSSSNRRSLRSANSRDFAAAAAATGVPKWFDKRAIFTHESPRPVVTYMSRNFFSRGVLNEADVLAYVLARYNVTLKVTTFEEPLLEVMNTLGATDVLFGMHGAGWTNALFIKRGATTMQMYPYGWRLPDNTTVRGYNYREIVYASECPYSEWVNPNRKHAFFRRIDYQKQWNLTYSLHPDPEWPLPQDSWPGNPWIYQNTFVDMKDFGPAIDAMMTQAGISRMPGL